MGRVDLFDLAGGTAADWASDDGADGRRAVANWPVSKRSGERASQRKGRPQPRSEFLKHGKRLLAVRYFGFEMTGSIPNSVPWREKKCHCTYPVVYVP